MAVAAAVAPQAANAAVITVNSQNDTIADDGQCTLREAIINANDNAQTHDDCDGGANPDTIIFAVASPITLSGTSIDITDSLLIDGPGEANLTIDAADASRIFTISDGTGTVLDVAIQDLTLTNGDSSSESNANGGAILSLENLILTNITISNSDSSVSGGGLSVEGGEGTTLALTIVDSTLTGNTADCCGGAGSAVYTSVSISGTQITNNDASYGGGLALYLSTSVTISDTVITGNDASYAGGGLYIYGLSGGAISRRSAATRRCTPAATR